MKNKLLLSTAIFGAVAIAAPSGVQAQDWFSGLGGAGGPATSSNMIVTTTTTTHFYDFPDSAPRVNIASSTTNSCPVEYDPGGYNTGFEGGGGGGGGCSGCSGATPDPGCPDAGAGGGSSSGGCFVTTAVVLTLNEPDDGPTLTNLRRLRDSHTITTERGPSRVGMYYALAPEIVRRINERPDSAMVWAQLHKRWIGPISTLIEAGNLAEADRRYVRMVKVMIWRYLIFDKRPMPQEIKGAIIQSLKERIKIT